MPMTIEKNPQDTRLCHHVVIYHAHASLEIAAVHEETSLIIKLSPQYFIIIVYS